VSPIGTQLPAHGDLTFFRSAPALWTPLHVDSASRDSASLTPRAGAGYTPLWFEGERSHAPANRLDPLRRIPPSVETGPSTNGAVRAGSAYAADILYLVRPTFKR